MWPEELFAGAVRLPNIPKIGTGGRVLLSTFQGPARKLIAYRYLTIVIM